jgi:hypothetical protein
MLGDVTAALGAPSFLIKNSPEQRLASELQSWARQWWRERTQVACSFHGPDAESALRSEAPAVARNRAIRWASRHAIATCCRA